MLQHRRTPSVLILAAVLGAGWLAVAWGPAEAAPASEPTRGRAVANRPLARLEIAIASPRATATDWYAYAEALWSLGQYADAAVACRRTLELEPYHREARFRLALAVAAAGQADEFEACLRDLAWSDAKLAVDVLAQPESRPYLDQPRFQALAREAQSQALD